MPEPEILKVPPVEAIAHFRAKGFHVGFDWRDTAAAEHLRSFTVAKMMRVDLLQDVHASVNAAITEGMSFGQFRAELEPLLRAQGWWGRKSVLDPVAGEYRVAQLGSTRRLRIIYDTNLRMSYAKGRWERIERVADERPWLRYVAVLDERTRPDHMAWHGTILRWDHPWWQTHYAPNGWRCRCLVQQLSDDDLAAFGFDPSPGPPPGSEATRAWTNKRTGETVQVPVGIDPGFAHNVGLVGRVAPAQKLLAEKIAAAPPDLAAAAKIEKLDDWIAAGRQERERLMALAGDVEAPSFVDNFRASLTADLRERRGAGSVLPELGVGKGGSKKLAKEIQEAVAMLPASWIRGGNTLPAVAGAPIKRAHYVPAHHGKRADIRASKERDPSTMLHEYTHHLQHAMPRLDDLFDDLHRRRTKGEPLKPIYGWAKRERGRRDKYIDAYAGKEYATQKGRRALEVITMGIQQTFYRVHGTEYLRDLVRDDPEMLDLILGALFRYDP